MPILKLKVTFNIKVNIILYYIVTKSQKSYFHGFNISWSWLHGWIKLTCPWIKWSLYMLHLLNVYLFVSLSVVHFYVTMFTIRFELSVKERLNIWHADSASTIWHASNLVILSMTFMLNIASLRESHRTISFLWRQRSRALYRDHFVHHPSVCLSAHLSVTLLVNANNFLTPRPFQLYHKFWVCDLYVTFDLHLENFNSAHKR